MHNKIQALAITGGIGSGKSTVLSLFKDFDYVVVDADKIVAQLYHFSHPLYPQVANTIDEWLGSNFKDVEIIDKKILRGLLEKTPNGFPKITQLLKPFVHDAMLQYFNSNSEAKLVFEVPLLIEAEMQDSFDKVLVITCNKDVRIERIQKRNPNLSVEQINHIISQQKSDEEKIQHADYVLDNSGSLEQLKEQFQEFMIKIGKKYKSKI